MHGIQMRAPQHRARLLVSACTFVAASGLGFAQLERVPAETKVPSVTVEELETSLDEDIRPLLIDVRLKEDFDSDPELIESATWKDPNEIDDWAKELDPNRPVVVYCVAGKWVSQSVTKRLKDLGLDASQVTGGIAAWKTAGNPTKPSTKR